MAAMIYSLLKVMCIREVCKYVLVKVECVNLVS
jgi:hypothetical protein